MILLRRKMFINSIILKPIMGIRDIIIIIIIIIIIGYI